MAVTHSWSSNYEKLLSLVDLPSLASRRVHLKLGHLFKIVHGLCFFPTGIVSLRQQTHHNCRSIHPFTLGSNLLLIHRPILNHLYPIQVHFGTFFLIKLFLYPHFLLLNVVYKIIINVSLFLLHFLLALTHFPAHIPAFQLNYITALSMESPTPPLTQDWLYYPWPSSKKLSFLPVLILHGISRNLSFNT